MKKFIQFFIIAVIGCCICTSCEKEGGIGSMEDLVGTYSVTVREDIVWGGDSGTVNDSGTIVITQIGGNRVQLRGLITTTGELVDDGKLYLDSESNIDSYGYLRTTYSSAIFAGGILTIWSTVSGQLSTTPNGTRYTFSSRCYFEGRKM